MRAQREFKDFLEYYDRLRPPVSKTFSEPHQPHGESFKTSEEKKQTSTSLGNQRFS